MTNFTHLSKQELLHELMAANTQFLLCLKNSSFERDERQQARAYLNAVLREVERRQLFMDRIRQPH